MGDPANDCLELTAPTDRYLNYCHWPYEPVASTGGKLRDVSLLLHSLQVGGAGPHAVPLVRAIQKELGLFRTVWGTKWIGGRLLWEFYFYDYQRREREVSIARVLNTIAPFIACPVRVDESLPYFMFSIDILPEVLAGRRALDEIHLYIGNPGSSVSSGIAYSVKPSGATLENFYFFFDAAKQLQEVAGKVFCSAYVDRGHVEPDQIIWPELRACRTICIANKHQNDTIYFSGVNVNQLVLFLTKLCYPSPLIELVQSNQRKLDHLLFDVGFDYLCVGGEVRIVKSGYYGVF